MAKQIQKGFTLIELMIVVAIIGILASIALPVYKDYITKVKWSGIIAELSPVKKSISYCLNDNSNMGTQCDTAAELSDYGMNSLPTPDNTSAAIVLSDAANAGVVKISITGNPNISADPSTPDTLTYISSVDASGSKILWVRGGSVPTKFVK